MSLLDEVDPGNYAIIAVVAWLFWALLEWGDQR